MKERLKKFYEDNRVLITICASVAMTTTVCVVAVKMIDGNTIYGIKEIEHSPGELSEIVVILKNGKVRGFTKPLDGS